MNKLPGDLHRILWRNIRGPLNLRSLIFSTRFLPSSMSEFQNMGFDIEHGFLIDEQGQL
jgi:hypothetical protein